MVNRPKDEPAKAPKPTVPVVVAPPSPAQNPGKAGNTQAKPMPNTGADKGKMTN